MWMYRVTQFSPDHLREAAVRGEDLNVMLGVPNWDALLEVYANHYSVTLWHEDQLVGCGGVVVLRPGVGEAWVMGGPEVHKHGRQVYKTCKRALDAAENIFRLRRMQATVLANQDKWIHFAQRMGFDIEGRLRKYGPDEQDYLMMARLKAWDQQ